MAIEYGSNARFRITVRNNGPDASTNTFVRFEWVRPGTSGVSSLAYSLSSSRGTCTVSSSSQSGCNFGKLGAGQSATINFDGTTSTDFIGEHTITVTARNAENSEAVSNDNVFTKRSIFCFGDCDDGESGGGGSTGVPLLSTLGLLVIRRFSRRSVRAESPLRGARRSRHRSRTRLRRQPIPW